MFVVHRVPVEPSGAPGHKTRKNINPPSPVLVTAKEQPQKRQRQLLETIFPSNLQPLRPYLEEGILIHVCHSLRVCTIVPVLGVLFVLMFNALVISCLSGLNQYLPL